jgi:hypothetical protein
MRTGKGYDEKILVTMWLGEDVMKNGSFQGKEVEEEVMKEVLETKCRGKE